MEKCRGGRNRMRLRNLGRLRLGGFARGWRGFDAWLGGWGYETFGTHWVAFGAAGVLLLGAAALSLQLPVRNMRVVPA